jgi:hypothetical protein
MAEMSRYLIPRRITQRWEILPGWGWRELAAAGVGLGVGVVLFAAASLIGLPLWLRALLVVVAVGCGVGLAMPMATGGSMLDMLLDSRAYGRTQHLYMYDLGRDDV